MGRAGRSIGPARSASLTLAVMMLAASSLAPHPAEAARALRQYPVPGAQQQQQLALPTSLQLTATANGLGFGGAAVAGAEGAGTAMVPDMGPTTVSDPAMIAMLQGGSSVNDGSPHNGRLTSRVDHVKSVLHGHAKSVGQLAWHGARHVRKHAGMIHERNPDMYLFGIAFLLLIIALASSFQKTIAKLRRDALHRELALEVLKEQTEQEFETLLTETKADEAKRDKRRELARLMKEADSKRVQVRESRKGGEEDFKEGRKEHLKDMQASLAALKEQLKGEEKPAPKPKRESRAVRKDK